ncbi:hypothetical protein [Streptomyces sp. NPDC048172]|uniref:effector-associated constant component EACC1 n=1 Tax=Streptomyces sp. NPDC048172 TaxID=3365505 RepID=UPI0037134E99
MRELTVELRCPRVEDTEAELRSLVRWLRADEEVGRHLRARPTASSAPAPGEMGAGFDLLQFAVATGLSGASLAVSLLQWREARRTPSVIRLRRGSLEVSIPPESTDEETVRRLSALFEAPGEPPSAPAPGTTDESADDAPAS